MKIRNILILLIIIFSKNLLSNIDGRISIDFKASPFSINSKYFKCFKTFYVIVNIYLYDKDKQYKKIIPIRLLINKYKSFKKPGDIISFKEYDPIRIHGIWIKSYKTYNLELGNSFKYFEQYYTNFIKENRICRCEKITNFFKNFFITKNERY